MLKAYAKWEENRYNEIFRLFMEELREEGHSPAYEWKSVHVEAELVRQGLEQKQREPSKARRRRVQIPARHRAAGGMQTKSSVHQPMPHHQQQRLPAVFDLTSGFGHYPSQHYGQHQHHPYGVAGGHKRELSAGSSSYDMLVEQLAAQPHPPLTDEQHEQLIDECLERTPFETEDSAMAALERHNNQHQHDDIKMSDDPYPEEQLPRSSRPPSSSLPAIDGMIASASASPDVNAQRSAAVARQACGELMKHSGGPAQHNNHQYAGV